MDTFLTLPAHWASSRLPTGVEPVNETLRTRGSVVSTSPMAAGRDAVTTLNTPAGSPARSARAASASAVSGVASAGLTMTGQPAASAGAHLRVIIASGKFHGVIAATTPTGSRNTRMRLSAPWLGNVSPAMRLASSA